MFSIEHLLTVTCLLLATGKGAFCQMKPSNAVAEIGGVAIFNCSGTSFLPNWLMSKDGTTSNQLPIAGSCNVNANLQNHYKTEQTGGPNACNLIVVNITMEQSGVYWCAESGAPSYVLLTVLDSSPSITYNNTPDVIERENVVITCTLNYSGSVEPALTLRPHFYWTDYTGNNVSSFYDSTPVNSPVISQLAVTAGRQDIMPYTCHVYLKLIPTTSPGYASNTPTVTNSASSPTITVLYGPSKPSSTSRPDEISINGVPCGISVLTCSSTANPAPSYSWYDSADNVILSSTNTLDLAEVNRNYTCEVYNTIRNVPHRASTTYTVSKDNCSTSAVNCCVCPRNETTSVTGEGCDNGTLCDCSQGSSGIILICNAKTFPNASYMWTGSDGQVTNGQVFNKVTANGTHRCTAYFDRASSNYTGNVIFPNGTNETTVDRCSTTISTIPSPTATTAHATIVSTPDANNDVAIIAVAIAMGVLFGISLVVNIILLIILIRGKKVPDLFKRTENIREPETLDPSDLSTPSAYEELRRPDEIRLQPTTYEQLTLKPPLYVNQVS